MLSDNHNVSNGQVRTAVLCRITTTVTAVTHTANVDHHFTVIRIALDNHRRLVAANTRSVSIQVLFTLRVCN